MVTIGFTELLSLFLNFNYELWQFFKEFLFETNKQINIFFSFNCRHLKKSEDDINSIFFWSALYFHFFGIDNKLYAGTE